MMCQLWGLCRHGEETGPFPGEEWVPLGKLVGPGSKMLPMVGAVRSPARNQELERVGVSGCG